MAVADSTATVDERLVLVGDVVERMAGALVDLEDDPARLILPTAPLTGRTAESWSATAERIAVLWQLYSATRDAVERMTVQRGTKALLNPHERAELAAGLTGPSVSIDGELVDAVRRATEGVLELSSPCSLDQLAGGFDLVVGSVTPVLQAVGEVWDRLLPELGELDRQLDAFRAEISDRGGRAPNELDAARQMVDTLRAKASTDPLDLDFDRLTEARASVDRVGAVAGAASGAPSTDETMALASAQLAATAERLDAAERSRTIAVEKVLGADRLPGTADERAELDGLRTELDALRTDGATDPTMVDRRLARVLMRLARLDGRLVEIDRASSALLVGRDELRRRLDAYRAKAAASGRAEDLDLDRLHRAASDLLYVAPCDVSAAAAAVDAYQHAINQHAIDQRTFPEDRR